MSDRIKHLFAQCVYAIAFPFIIVYALITAPFIPKIRHKKRRRIILEASIRWIQWCQIRLPMKREKQVSRDNYKVWCAKYGVEEDIESLGAGAELLWIGRKGAVRGGRGAERGPERAAAGGSIGSAAVRTPRRVILYFHGGAFIFCLQPFAINFLNYIRHEASKGLKESDGSEADSESIAVAMLAYSLFPDATFPTQLHQAVLALRSLLDQGIDPSNIIVMGDSAGGNLVVQLLGHLLHPIPSIPSLKIDPIPAINTNIKLGGAYLLSPWATMVPAESHRTKGTWKSNDGYDILSTKAVVFGGTKILQTLREAPGVFQALEPYITLHGAPEGWWAGLEKRVGRVLVSAGELEVMCGDIVEMGKRFGEVHKDVEVLVVKGGIHNDPTFDFFFEDELKPGQEVDGKELKQIVDWARGVFAVGR
ncbi:hypothetical protein CVT24_004543 [Panaeolus cyanescens]|uniref:Alpha/beta hydrolase fold-3 domain-containing protein n=1 Tax=Panaeolus cyanescens TaxID=181874 RepID=A0A409W1C3_9AGAR|nr:hypothetical protein CVT24_004543 [Panaeolus cyanescens]